MTDRAKIFILALALFLGACGHYNEDLASLDKVMTSSSSVTMAAAPQDIAPAAGDEESLARYLAREYYDLAKFENEKAYDYKAAKNYTQKAMMASKGKVAMPAKISSYDIPSDKMPALTDARAALVAALAENNTPENQMALAKAQSRFDCWLERAEEAADDEHCASCRSEFEQAMAMLIAPAAGVEAQSGSFDINFAQNSAAFDEASMETIGKVAAFVNAPENAGYGVVLTGYASVQSEFASRLANARATTVRDALIAQGVSSDVIAMNIDESAQDAGIMSVSAGGGDASGADRKVRIVLVKPQPVSGTVQPSLEIKPAPPSDLQKMN